MATITGANTDPVARHRSDFLRRLLWALGLTVPLTCLRVDILAEDKGLALGRDFANFWVAGLAVRDGETLCLFDVGCFQGLLLRHLQIFASQNYSYPPHTLFLNLTLSPFPYFVALGLWTAFGIGFFLACARSWLPPGFPKALAVLTPAAAFTIWDGQYGFLFGGLWLLAFASLQRQQVRAGIVGGLMTFKPHLGLLLGLVMVVRGRWRAIVVAVAVTLMLVAASALAFGPATWLMFLRDTLGQQVAILTDFGGQFYYRMMPSAYPRLGWPGQLAFAAFALFSLWRLRTLPIRQLAFPAATATALILPYSFNYDMVVQCLGFAILLCRPWRELGAARVIVFALAYNAPQMTFFIPVAVPFILAAGLWVQGELLLDPASGTAQDRPAAG